MKHQVVRQDPGKTFIKPGFGFVPRSPERLWSVVGSSIVISVYDYKRRAGGMAHFARAYREQGGPSSTFYAAPAIVWLLQQMLHGGSAREDLEAHVVGGAFDPKEICNYPRIHEDNVKVSLEILRKEKIELGTVDVGGKRGRKVIFNTWTGETVVARVDRIRKTDWYPIIAPKAT